MTNERTYREALQRIIDLSDLEMRDGDGARDIAKAALTYSGEPPAQSPGNRLLTQDEIRESIKAAVEQVNRPAESK